MLEQLQNFGAFEGMKILFGALMFQLLYISLMLIFATDDGKPSKHLSSTSIIFLNGLNSTV